MAKQIGANNLSTEFRELLASKSKTLDIHQYDLCQNEWKGVHDRKMFTTYLLTIVLFSAGLWAVWEHALFIAVLLLSLAANFNRQSADHILVSELLGSQRLLAMLINAQSQDLKSLRRQGGTP